MRLLRRVTLTALTAGLLLSAGAAPGLATPHGATRGPDYAAAARQRVFFGHQSVGMNILDGIPAAYRKHHVPVPPILEAPGHGSGPVVSHAFIGENGDPAGKIDAFAAQIRSGVGRNVDVALLKLCFVDVTASTDVVALFRKYRTTLDGLQRDFPDVVFLHVTNPLTTGPSKDNVVRQRLNTLLRRQYARSGRLFDLAASESTRADGRRTGGRLHGARYYALNPAYAADSGHLNATGSRAVADRLLRTIAAAVGN